MTELTDLNRLVNHLHEMLRLTVGSRIDVHIESDADLWNVIVSKQQVELAIINLAINARDAMPNGGMLTIRTANTSLVVQDADLAPGDYVCLIMTDTGEGMQEEILARASEAFFTTKPVGKGTGLGLSMVRSTAANSGGSLRIDSALGQGTSVSIYFRRAVV